MTAPIPTSPVLPALYSAPNREIIGDASNGTNGIRAITEAANHLAYHKVGTLVNDSFDEDEVALTDDDQYYTAGVHRRWFVKTPRYLNLQGAYSKFTVWFYCAVASGTIEYEVYVNNVLAGEISFTGVLSLGWHEATVYSGNLTLDDSLTAQEIRLELITWNGSNTTTYRIRDVASYHILDQTVFDVGEFRDNLIPSPTDIVAKNLSCNTFILRELQKLLINVWENRVGQIVTGCRYTLVPDVSTTDLQSVTKLRLNVPKGVTQARFRFLCLRGAGTTARLAISGYSGDNIETDHSKIPNPYDWYVMNYNVTPAGSPVLLISANNIYIYCICAEYVTGSY